MKKRKSYTELINLPTFLDRYNYLKVDGIVCEETFGCQRYLNQILYRSRTWKAIRRDVIIRDNACDLAMPGYELSDKGMIIIHHINPLTLKEVIDRDPKIFDPENLVVVSYNTHQAIHYGDESLLILDPVERTPNDTIPWR